MVVVVPLTIFTLAEALTKCQMIDAKEVAVAVVQVVVDESQPLARAPFTNYLQFNLQKRVDKWVIIWYNIYVKRQADRYTTSHKVNIVQRDKSTTENF